MLLRRRFERRRGLVQRRRASQIDGMGGGGLQRQIQTSCRLRSKALHRVLVGSSYLLHDPLKRNNTDVSPALCRKQAGVSLKVALLFLPATEWEKILFYVLQSHYTELMLDRQHTRLEPGLACCAW